MGYLVYYRAHMETTIKCSLCGKETSTKDVVVKLSLRGKLSKVHQTCLNKITGSNNEQVDL